MKRKAHHFANDEDVHHLVSHSTRNVANNSSIKNVENNPMTPRNVSDYSNLSNTEKLESSNSQSIVSNKSLSLGNNYLLSTKVVSNNKNYTPLHKFHLHTSTNIDKNSILKMKNIQDNDIITVTDSNEELNEPLMLDDIHILPAEVWATISVLIPDVKLQELIRVHPLFNKIITNEYMKRQFYKRNTYLLNQKLNNRMNLLTIINDNNLVFKGIQPSIIIRGGYFSGPEHLHHISMQLCLEKWMKKTSLERLLKKRPNWNIIQERFAMTLTDTDFYFVPNDLKIKVLDIYSSNSTLSSNDKTHNSMSMVDINDTKTNVDMMIIDNIDTNKDNNDNNNDHNDKMKKKTNKSISNANKPHINTKSRTNSNLYKLKTSPISNDSSFKKRKQSFACISPTSSAISPPISPSIVKPSIRRLSLNNINNNSPIDINKIKKQQHQVLKEVPMNGGTTVQRMRLIHETELEQMVGNIHKDINSLLLDSGPITKSSTNLNHQKLNKILKIQLDRYLRIRPSIKDENKDEKIRKLFTFDAFMICPGIKNKLSFYESNCCLSTI